MRVHVVSDVHGNAEALARAGEGADALVVLGDLIDFVDYHDHGKGILGTLFGADKVATFAELRRSRQHGATAAFARSLWAGLDNPAERIEELIRDQYAALFGALTAPTYATPGNVDAPALWPEYAPAGVRLLDNGATADIGGLRFGFVGGGVLPPGAAIRRTGVWVPNLRPEAEFAAAVAALDRDGGVGKPGGVVSGDRDGGVGRTVDVLCSHIPPALPELTYDVIARRAEVGSTSLRAAIDRHRPRWSIFGHVHQPLAARMRVGHTECVNVGHFQRTGVPHVLRW
jgi:Icc-related predicted phosphoesterase